MFNDLYKYIPDEWKFYITENDLKPIIEKLNKLNPNSVIPNKSLIFSALRLVSPENIKCIIITDIIPNQKLSCGIPFPEKTSQRQIFLEEILGENSRENYLKYENLFDPINIVKQGILLINFPLTCAPGMQKAHLGVRWEKLLKSLIEKLIYREKVLILFSINEIGNKIYTAILKDWFPDKNIEYYYSAEHNNCFYIPYCSTKNGLTKQSKNKFILLDEILERNKMEKINWFGS